MKNYFNFVSENVDPYNEENWGDNKNFLIKAVEQNNKIVFVAVSVKDKDEARLKMTKDTGVTDEYGDLIFEEVTLDNIKDILKSKRDREKVLDDELQELNDEILSLREGLGQREH